MSKIKRFDVLIVYNRTSTKSASDASINNQVPFPLGSPNESYNAVYSYFLSACQKLNVEAAFTTSRDITGPGICQSYWSFKNGKWQKHNTVCSANLIFEKFSPRSKSGKILRKLLFSSDQVKPFNDTTLFNLFFDKQKTYEILSKHAIPTISVIENNLESIRKACRALKKMTILHAGSEDFGQDIVMKDRYGSGGNNVYKFNEGDTKEMLSVMDENSKVAFIIQPLVKFDKGFVYNDIPASTDIRLIYHKGKIIQSYIRVAKSNEFRCNSHQGGVSTYLTLAEIPRELIQKANSIAKTLDNKHSLYSLDFIISNNGNIYFLEGNTGPGLNWDLKNKSEATKSKKLIRLIVEELASRTNQDVILRQPLQNL